MDEGETMSLWNKIKTMLGEKQEQPLGSPERELLRKVRGIYANGLPCTITDHRTGKRLVGRHVTDDMFTIMWRSIGEGQALVMVDVEDLPYQLEKPEPIPGAMMVVEFVYYEVDIADVQYYSG